MGSKEDKLVNNLIVRSRDKSEEYLTDMSVEPEAHYNHYSMRGVVDLYIQKEYEYPDEGRARNDVVYEVKAPSAVSSSTGANEIIRQFNRMCEAFYKSEQRRPPGSCTFQLAFVLTPETVLHVAENLPMYTSVDTAEISVPTCRQALSSVVFYSLQKKGGPAVRLHGEGGEEPHTPDEWAKGIASRAGAGPGVREQALAILENEYGFGYEPRHG